FSCSQRVWAAQLARERVPLGDATQQLPKGFELLLGEQAREPLVHARAMGQAELLEEPLALGREARLDVACVLLGAGPLDQPGPLEPVDPAREAARAQDHRLGNVVHAQAAAL